MRCARDYACHARKIGRARRRQWRVWAALRPIWWNGAACGLVPEDRLAPFSLVCKAVSANGRPTVKLSDNPAKAMGPAAEIARYKRVFGVGDQQVQEVQV